MDFNVGCSAKTDRDPLCRRRRFRAEIIGHAVWLYFRSPLSLRMVEDMLAAQGIIVSHQTSGCERKNSDAPSNRIRRRSCGQLGDKWHLDEAVISIGGEKHWLWRAVHQDGFVLEVLGARPPQCQGSQTPDAQAAEGPRPCARMMVTDTLRSCDVAKREVMPGVEHRSHDSLNNRAANSHQPTRRRERIMKRFKSRRQLQRFISIHDPIANLFLIPRHDMSASHHRELRAAAMRMRAAIARI